MSEIAKRAGVRRATVYNHFPTERELLDACSSHWFAENPPPDPTPWAEIQDPRRRTEVALGALYAYYDHGKAMLGKVLPDAPLVPALEDILRQKWEPMLEGVVEMLAGGWRSSDVEGRTIHATSTEDAEGQRTVGDADAALRATLRVALDFFTWQTLAASGLSNDEAAHVAATWVRSASTHPTSV